MRCRSRGGPDRFSSRLTEPAPLGRKDESLARVERAFKESSVKTWLEKIRQWPWDLRLLIVFAGLSLLPLFVSFWAHEEPAKSPPLNVDTHIPRGFVLVPIEIENYEAVDSILGRFAIVDLFKSSDAKVLNEPVATNVRLLRAPLNPSHFAVLVPEKEAPRLVHQGGVYTVVVKRPDSTGTAFVNSPTQRKRKIIFEGN